MAKGVEDTLMYTFNRYIGQNEVGDSPANSGVNADAFHVTAPPPEGSFFGRSRGSGEPAACTNPADLAGGVGGEQVDLHAVFPSDASS